MEIKSWQVALCGLLTICFGALGYLTTNGHFAGIFLGILIGLVAGASVALALPFTILAITAALLAHMVMKLVAR